MYQAVDAMDELLADHGPRCGCEPCADAAGMRYTLNTFRSLAECIAYPFLETNKRTIAQLREAGADHNMVAALEAALVCTP